MRYALDSVLYNVHYLDTCLHLSLFVHDVYVRHMHTRKDRASYFNLKYRAMTLLSNYMPGVHREKTSSGCQYRWWVSLGR